MLHHRRLPRSRPRYRRGGSGRPHAHHLHLPLMPGHIAFTEPITMASMTRIPSDITARAPLAAQWCEDPQLRVQLRRAPRMRASGRRDAILYSRSDGYGVPEFFDRGAIRR